MGNLMRQYWMPAIRSDELPAPDCPPAAHHAAGREPDRLPHDSGAVGLMQNSCPHRGASMFFGRNEEEGLRCVYHGWKFDATGACVDMPSEPAESNFKNKVHARAYPTHERNGIIWAYMGPRDVPPPLPEIEANILCEGPHQISVLHRPCNWMQGSRARWTRCTRPSCTAAPTKSEDYEPGSFNYYQYRQRAAKFVTVETEYGTANGAYRPAEEDSYYWRVTQILLPFYHMIPGGALGEGVRIGVYVPMDDDHHMQWEIGVFKPGRRAGFAPARQPAWQAYRARLAPQVPNGTGWYDRFRIDQNLANDYLIDREEQARLGKLHRHPRHPPAGLRRDRDHGHDLRPQP